MPSRGALQRSCHLLTVACLLSAQAKSLDWGEKPLELHSCVLVFHRPRSSVFQALSLHQKQPASPTQWMGHLGVNRMYFIILLPITLPPSAKCPFCLCSFWAPDLSSRATGERGSSHWTEDTTVSRKIQCRVASPEARPSNISWTCLLLCLFYYRERLCEYCT